MRLHSAQCTYAAQGFGAVRESSPSSCVLFVVVLRLWRCGGSHAEGQQPPNPEGWTYNPCCGGEIQSFLPNFKSDDSGKLPNPELRLKISLLP